MIFPMECEDCTTEETIGRESWNYVFGGALILMITLGSLANPIIILHHFKQTTISAKLFIGFSLSALVHNTLRGLMVIWNLLRTTVSTRHVEPNVMVQLATVLNYSTYWTSITFITIVSVSRHISIEYPFHHINRKYVYFYLLFYILVVPALFTLILTKVVSERRCSSPGHKGQ